MKSLNGILKASELDLVNRSKEIRFKDSTKFKTPEALLIYEQGLLDEDTLFRCCQESYTERLERPVNNYIPKNVVDVFKDTNYIPIRLNTIGEEITIMTIPEFKNEPIPQYKNYKCKVIYTTIYYFVKRYTTIYETPDFIARLPAADLFEYIKTEAIEKKAIDVTISSKANSIDIYYNIKREKVFSNRCISREDIKDILVILGHEAGATFDQSSKIPRKFSINLDLNNRGRVIVVNTYHGVSITIRVIPNEILSLSLEDLNIDEKTRNFIRQYTIGEENGLRLMIGPTMSGKNTTMLSSLLELASRESLKFISIENPVETLVDFMEQIDTETEEEFKANVEGLLRQNPDIGYLSEMTDTTATSIMEASNTGKRIFSTIHSNSIAYTVSRIQDMTGLSIDRIILALHSCIYQEFRGKGKDMRPYTKCLYFSEELKARLLGKNLGEIYLILREEENIW